MITVTGRPLDQRFEALRAVWAHPAHPARAARRSYGYVAEGHAYEVERADAAQLSPREFAVRFMLRNRPVILRGATRGWRAAREWGDAAGAVRCMGDGREARVARCSEREFSDQPRVDMTLGEWLRRSASEADLYVKDLRADPAHYETPPHAADDWMEDRWPGAHRFVYAGRAGTWTPLHCDVFSSYSWSANVCGRKEWLLFPPDAAPLVRGVYNAEEPGAAPKEALRRCVRVEQGPGELIFVPSGWAHQVRNLDDTVSVNANWFNAFSVDLVDAHMRREMEAVRDAMSGFFCDGDQAAAEPEEEREEREQRVLMASAAMDLCGWHAFLAAQASAQARRLRCAWSRRDAHEAAVALLGMRRVCDAAARLERREGCVRRNASARHRAALASAARNLSRWERPWHLVAEWLDAGGAGALAGALFAAAV